jgi:hypothetical protein
MAIRVAVEDTIFTPVRSANDDVDRLPGPGVKGVRDTNCGGRFSLATCSLCGVQIPAGGERPSPISADVLVAAQLHREARRVG